MRANEGVSSRIFDVFNIVFMCGIIMMTLYPIMYIIAISLSSNQYVMANMVTIFPKGFNLNSYANVFETKIFWVAYGNTILYTVLGTAVNMVMTCCLAYVLSRKDFILRNPVTIFVVITMFFSGGLVPYFIVINKLGLYNSMWSMIFPGAINTFNMIIIRTYMQGLPDEMWESASIDGANDLRIFIRIIIPLCMPVIATIALFYAVGHWNAYFMPMLLFRDRAKVPLQVVLRNMIVDNNMQGMANEAKAAVKQKPTSEMVIATSMVVAMLPIVCVYPFAQKYFVKGIMIGSLKG